MDLNDFHRGKSGGRCKKTVEITTTIGCLEGDSVTSLLYTPLVTKHSLRVSVSSQVAGNFIIFASTCVHFIFD